MLNSYIRGDIGILTASTQEESSGLFQDHSGRTWIFSKARNLSIGEEFEGLCILATLAGERGLADFEL